MPYWTEMPQGGRQSCPLLGPLSDGLVQACIQYNFKQFFGWNRPAMLRLFPFLPSYRGPFKFNGLDFPCSPTQGL